MATTDAESTTDLFGVDAIRIVDLAGVIRSQFNSLAVLSTLVRLVKTTTCDSRSGKTALTYEIGAAGAQICARVTQSSGSGTFSKDWVALSRVHQALERNHAVVLGRGLKLPCPA